MQSSAPELMDLSGESEETKAAYGVDRDDPQIKASRGGGTGSYRSFARNCLLARRLVERGVRCVNIFHASWDHHSNLDVELAWNAGMADQPIAALLKDLKQRGLLDSTLVFFGGEMGRLPVVQIPRGGKFTPGRDHNTDGFSIWLAGGGVKGGHIHGATDEFGLFAVQDIVRHTDYLSTVMHLHGLDANKLVYKRNGRNETILDGQPGEVIRGILA
jgi:uncharacterized protein (DUF1501 family)